LLSRRDAHEDSGAILQQRALYLALAEVADARVIDTMEPQSREIVLRELEKCGVLA
jgi:hypothetical protein